MIFKCSTLGHEMGCRPSSWPHILCECRWRAVVSDGARTWMSQGSVSVPLVILAFISYPRDSHCQLFSYDAKITYTSKESLEHVSGHGLRWSSKRGKLLNIGTGKSPATQRKRTIKLINPAAPHEIRREGHGRDHLWLPEAINPMSSSTSQGKMDIASTPGNNKVRGHQRDLKLAESNGTSQME